MPQKAERFRTVILAAMRYGSGADPTQFAVILPDLARFLTQDCYVDKWAPHKIDDILVRSSGDNIVGNFTVEQYSKQNKMLAFYIAGLSYGLRQMMIAYTNNRPITQEPLSSAHGHT